MKFFIKKLTPTSGTLINKAATQALPFTGYWYLYIR